MLSILSDNQKRLLELLSRESFIVDEFYFGGGTVLAEYYLHHRLSEDLDFFSSKEVDPAAISAILKKIKVPAGITEIRFEQAFNRNLFFLKVGEEIIKTEFTYFPFERIQPTLPGGEMQIDSLIDIAVNKVFTIFQKPRSRDFIDLYCILQKEPWTIADLSRKAQVKFDTHVDPLQLGAQFMRVEELKDYPRMLISLEPEEWQVFFVEAAKKLRLDVLG